MSPDPLDFPPDEAPEAVPDVMARILEPRVRSGAKNHPKSPKTSAPVDIPAAPAIAPLKAAPPATAPAMAPEVDDLREMVLALRDKEATRDRVFDLLYEELRGYKDDFYLERLKPTLRALLFLLDSMEGFEAEIAGEEAVPREVVAANLTHFADQLRDVLALSGLSPIENEGDEFNPKIQRAVEVVSVGESQNGRVVRQIRGGWKQGEKLFRPADVVVGKSE